MLAQASANPAPTAAAQRVLVVGGNGALSSTLRRLLPQASVVELPNALLALGEVGVAGPPAALLMRWAGAADQVRPTAAALRRLAPRSRLLSVTGASGLADAQAAVAAGFDGYVVEPVSPEALAKALAADDAPTPAPAAAPAPGAVASRPHANDLAATLVRELLATPGAADAAPAPSEPLGDIDLLAALLDPRRDLTDLLQGVLRARGGLTGARLVPASGPASGSTLPAPGEARVTLEDAGTPLAVLRAPPPATVAALAPWAEWAGHWLRARRRLDRLWDMALRDDLTGAFNRRYFSRFLQLAVDRAARERFRVTLMVFDIDDFKRFNDCYGHAAGDEILREAAHLMHSVVRHHDVVARIGGDEFAVIFWDAEQPRRPNSEHPNDVRKAARRFQQAIHSCRFPKLAQEAPGTLTISGGLAGFPWDGRTADELLQKADAMALQSKRQGKNALTFGPGALRDSAGLPDPGPAPGDDGAASPPAG